MSSWNQGGQLCLCCSNSATPLRFSAPCHSHILLKWFSLETWNIRGVSNRAVSLLYFYGSWDFSDSGVWVTGSVFIRAAVFCYLPSLHVLVDSRTGLAHTLLWTTAACVGGLMLPLSFAPPLHPHWTLQAQEKVLLWFNVLEAGKWHIQ